MSHHHDQTPSKKARQHFKKKFGGSLTDHLAHQSAHQEWSRRDFVRMTGLAGLGTALSLGTSTVRPFAPNSLMTSLANADCGDRALVLIRLRGGNDGLNTVIHRGNDDYYNIRPTLAIPESGLWGLNDDYGMPNEMTEWQQLWGDGHMQVIHNVGYPNANYSHFRSSDIWASASDSYDQVTTGWIGRWLDQELPAFQSAAPVVPPALQIGVETNMIFRAVANNMALSISNPESFYQIALTGQLYSTLGLTNEPNQTELRFTREIANSAFRYSESIRDAYNFGSNDVDYPADNNLAEQLSIVARLIKGNLGSKVYMVTIGGFDTHSDQADTHPILQMRLATAVKSFFDDLQSSGHSQNVLAMTFSEFGRTIYENGSLGTDHGTGAPMFVFGENIGQQLHGDAPDLNDLNAFGDPNFSVDFRQAYATVLQNWLCVAPEVIENVLGGNDFGVLPDMLPPSSPPLGLNEAAQLLGHNPDPEQPGFIQIKYAMRQRGQVRLRILSPSGEPLRVLVDAFQERGSYIFRLQPGQVYLPPGKYFYRLETSGRTLTRPISW